MLDHLYVLAPDPLGHISARWQARIRGVTLKLTCKEGADSTKIISIGSLCSRPSPQPLQVCTCLPARTSLPIKNWKGSKNLLCIPGLLLQGVSHQPQAAGRGVQVIWDSRMIASLCFSAGKTGKFKKKQNQNWPLLEKLVLKNSRNFPGVPVSKTPCSQCRGLRFHPWSGN